MPSTITARADTRLRELTDSCATLASRYDFVPVEHFRSCWKSVRNAYAAAHDSWRLSQTFTPDQRDPWLEVTGNGLLLLDTMHDTVACMQQALRQYPHLAEDLDNDDTYDDTNDWVDQPSESDFMLLVDPTNPVKKAFLGLRRQLDITNDDLCPETVPAVGQLECCFRDVETAIMATKQAWMHEAFVESKRTIGAQGNSETPTLSMLRWTSDTRESAYERARFPK